MPVAFGIYDTHDKCWLGSDAGPKLFVVGQHVNGRPLDEDNARVFARVTAQVTNVQMAYPANRLEARLYDEDAVHLRDEVPTAMSPAEALRRACGDL